LSFGLTFEHYRTGHGKRAWMFEQHNVANV